MVRIIGAISSESDYFLDKFPQHHKLINNEYKNVFSYGLKAAALKFASGFKMRGTRDFAINKNVIDSSCQRCSEIECLDHTVKCRCTEGKRDVCLNKLRKSLAKADDAREDALKIDKIVNEISKCLKNEALSETNQEIFFLRNVF